MLSFTSSMLNCSIALPAYAAVISRRLAGRSLGTVSQIDGDLGDVMGIAGCIDSEESGGSMADGAPRQARRHTCAYVHACVCVCLRVCLCAYVRACMCLCEREYVCMRGHASPLCNPAFWRLHHIRMCCVVLCCVTLTRRRCEEHFWRRAAEIQRAVSGTSTHC